MVPSPTCVSVFARFACSSLYPECDSASPQTPTLPCQSLCSAALDACQEPFHRVGPIAEQQLPKCDGGTFFFPDVPYQTTSCLSVGGSSQDAGSANTTSSSGPSTNSTSVGTPSPSSNTSYAGACPPPLLPNPHPFEQQVWTEGRFCQAACCLPCPALDMFYPPNQLTNYKRYVDVVRVISALASLFVFLSFWLLGKKEHPSCIIMWFSFAIFLFNCPVFFIAGGATRKDMQCSDRITSTSFENSSLCAVQGSLLVFASNAASFWVSYLILNLHLVTVWNVNFFAGKYVWVHLFNWGIPAALTGYIIREKAIRYEFGSLCFVKSEYSDFHFFVPLAVLITVAFVLHLITMFYIGRITLRAGRGQDSTVGGSSGVANMMGSNGLPMNTRMRVVLIWQSSWRSMTLSTFYVLTFYYFWNFYENKISPIKYYNFASPWVVQWEACMFNGDQLSCSHVAAPYHPSYAYMISAELLPSLGGIGVFCIFGARANLFQEWRNLFTRQPLPRSPSFTMIAKKYLSPPSPEPSSGMREPQPPFHLNNPHRSSTISSGSTLLVAEHSANYFPYHPDAAATKLEREISIEPPSQAITSPRSGPAQVH
ncbi:hypothetical protein HK101_007879 [Irineochytrium annulatum]|nr:hypothetical protein HK101_007879 [Irineochytrium annulatum]